MNELILQVTNAKKELTIASLHLNNEECRKISEGLMKNNELEKLDLVRCQLNDESFEFLFEGLSFSQSITMLNLGQNKLRDGKLISKYIKFSQNVRGIDLSSNHFGGCGMEDLSDALKSNSSLEGLDLSHNKIVDHDCLFLAPSLSTNNTLSVLDLRNNEIGEEGAKELFESLKYNKSIKKINLRDNLFGAQSIDLLCELMKSNSTLTGFEFNMAGNLNDQREEDIYFYLLCNNQPNFLEKGFFFFPSLEEVFIYFILCIKEIQKSFHFKIPKQLVLEILKWVDKKSFVKLWRLDERIDF